ncbi:hypothetical protein ACXYMO_09040 [Arenibacterium sp. CAU 1754]
MSFIRPEARAAIWRWRELLVGVGMIAVGASWALGPAGLLGWIGFAVIVAGISLSVVGIQRARFRGAADGPGVVTVDEGQITYFGPLSGGAIAAADLERVTLDPTANPAHWVLSQPDQPHLTIPVNAAGADALFDVFSSLPGIRTERMLAQMRDTTLHPVVIWERKSMRPPDHRLH